MLTLRRKRLRDHEKQQIKSNIKQNLPILNKRQIRRHRKLFYEALILELLEDQFEEAAYCLRGLIEYEDEVYRLAGDEALAWNKPKLKEDHKMLLVLYEGLKAAETELKNDNKIEEIRKLLEVATFFSKQIEPWWWIAEQLFMISINTVKDYKTDGDKFHALARFAFGKFSLRQLGNADRAIYNLEICRGLCIGENWATTEVPRSNLYKECCILLCDAFLITAEEHLQTDPAVALKYINMAYKSAHSGEYTAGEANSLYKRGMAQLGLDKLDNAIETFNKVLIMFYSSNNQTGICNTRIGLARAYNRLQMCSEAKYHLHQMLYYTQKHDLKSSLALCHRNLGQIHIYNNIGHEASSHLKIAFEMYHELGDYDNREQTKGLAAVANGMQLIRQLMKLINNCGKTKSNYDNMTKLLRYKDNRTPFLDEDKLTYLKYLFNIYGESDNEEEFETAHPFTTDSDNEVFAPKS